LLLLNAVSSQIDDINILVPVNQNIIDPKYAELAIQAINKILNLKIDITELDKESKEVEAKIKDLIKKSKETHDTFKKASEDSGPSMYA
jgi:Archaeal enzymes of ATP-grasp superfamily